MVFRPQFPAESIGDKSGYSLLLAVVITAAVISTATSMASVVRSEIRQTGALAAADRAYAQAESEAERAIFVLRRSTLTFDAVRTRFTEGVAIESDLRPQRFQIRENDFVSLPTLSDAPAERLIISAWRPGGDCLAPEESWVEITRVRWNAEGGFLTDRQLRSWSADEIQLNLDNDTVEVRIRALYCDIDEIEIQGAAVRMRIRAHSEIGNVSQSVEAILPQSATVSGLFDFVLFSECEIVKGIGGVTGQPLCP